jgi:hypothetical protein
MLTSEMLFIMQRQQSGRAVKSGVYKLRPAVTFQMTRVYQVRHRLLRVRVLFASRGQFSGMTVV